MVAQYFQLFCYMYDELVIKGIFSFSHEIGIKASGVLKWHQVMQNRPQFSTTTKRMY